ncbi:MAG TPA: 3-hydroxyacyl-ACP dehydratase FabZ [Atribacterota bacterium]|nr:3-hydroxyacyl-ACP dehydratase FabZ [Atribacterota bacterium]
MLNIDDIKKIIPHRYPFLFIDYITELVLGERAVGYKNVTANEPFFQGHFPQEMIMPGVLIIESLAQVGAVAILSQKENKGKLAYFAGINKAAFKRKVVPGDRLKLEVEIIKKKGLFGLGRGIATVDGQIAVKSELLFALEGKNNQIV